MYSDVSLIRWSWVLWILVSQHVFMLLICMCKAQELDFEPILGLQDKTIVFPDYVYLMASKNTILDSCFPVSAHNKKRQGKSQQINRRIKALKAILTPWNNVVSVQMFVYICTSVSMYCQASLPPLPSCHSDNELLPALKLIRLGDEAVRRLTVRSVAVPLGDERGLYWQKSWVAAGMSLTTYLPGSFIFLNQHKHKSNKQAGCHATGMSREFFSMQNKFDAFCIHLPDDC